MGQLAQLADVFEPIRTFQEELADVAAAFEPIKGFHSHLENLANRFEPMRAFQSQLVRVAEAFHEQLVQLASAMEPATAFQDQLQHLIKAFEPAKALQRRFVELSRAFNANGTASANGHNGAQRQSCGRGLSARRARGGWPRAVHSSRRVSPLWIIANVRRAIVAWRATVEVLRSKSSRRVCAAVCLHSKHRFGRLPICAIQSAPANGASVRRLPAALPRESEARDATVQEFHRPGRSDGSVQRRHRSGDSQAVPEGRGA